MSAATATNATAPSVRSASSLAAVGLGFDRGRRRIVADVHLQLARGEVLALLGPNGAGKSTLLRLLLGLLRPGSGAVLLDGQPLAAVPRRVLARRLSYVPQLHVPPFPYSVEQVVVLGRLAGTSLLRAPGRKDRAVVHELLQRVGIAHLADSPYTEISGGERQLALIARALAQGADFLIMDEPATGLDYGHQHRLLMRLRALAAAGYGVVFTTHHPEHALLAADRTLLLQAGRLHASGPTAEVLTPASIESLYGVRVRVATDAAGRCGFIPDCNPPAQAPSC